MLPFCIGGSVDLIKTINDYLIVYNVHEQLYEQLQHEPVVYYADYKVQKIKLPSGRYNLMVSKFDKGKLDFKKFCDIKLVDYDVKEAVVHIINYESSSMMVSYVHEKSPLISQIGNYSGSITAETTKDEFFNITVGYEIPFSYEDIIQYLHMVKYIKKHSWIYQI